MFNVVIDVLGLKSLPFYSLFSVLFSLISCRLLEHCFEIPPLFICSVSEYMYLFV